MLTFQRFLYVRDIKAGTPFVSAAPAHHDLDITPPVPKQLAALPRRLPALLADNWE